MKNVVLVQVQMRKALTLIELQVKGTGKGSFGAGVHDNTVTSSIEAIIAYQPFD